MGEAGHLYLRARAGARFSRTHLLANSTGEGVLLWHSLPIGSLLLGVVASSDQGRFPHA
jgi:hypothetical protein